MLSSRRDNRAPREGHAVDHASAIGAEGLAEALPAGERVLWSGAPQPKLIARDALHARAVAGYFVLAAAVQSGLSLRAGSALPGAALNGLGVLGAGAIALLLLLGFALLVARTTRYVITDRRVVLRFGIALPVTLNLPFAAIRSVDAGRRGDGSGGLAFEATERGRLLYVVLWPHARPWHFWSPQPMLRGLPDVDAVVRILAPALRAAHPGRSVQSGATLPAGRGLPIEAAA